jgi:hypothetical protein
MFVVASLLDLWPLGGCWVCCKRTDIISVFAAVFEKRFPGLQKFFGSLGITVKAPNILCHQCAKAS